MKKILLVFVSFCSVYFSQNLFAQNGACIPSIGVDCVTIPKFIDSVSTTFAMTNFTNNGTDCNTQDQNYQDYANKIASEQAGGSFNLHVGLNHSNAAFCGIWIDWNDDLTFGPGEQIFLSSVPITMTSQVVNVPMAAVSDTLIIRIRSGSVSMGPCDSIGAGETEDYRLIILDPQGIQSFSDEAWTIYPNPANDFLNVELGNDSRETEISVIDLLGNVVSSEMITNGKTRIDLSALPHGMYFVRINANGQVGLKKFVR